MENENKQETVIDLRVIFYVLWRKLFWIVAFAIIGALLLGLYSTFFIKPVYSSTAKFYVNNNTDSAVESKVSTADLSASKTLAGTAIVITQNNKELLQAIVDDSGTKYSGSALAGMISAGTYSDTEAFYISVTSTSASDAYALAKSFQKLLPDEIAKVMLGGDIKPFDAPVMPTTPNNGNVVTKNALIGALAGAVLSFLVFFLQEVFDNTIYSEEDLKNLKHKYPVIGLIPSIDVDIPEQTRKKKKTPAKAHSDEGGAQ